MKAEQPLSLPAFVAASLVAYIAADRIDVIAREALTNGHNAGGKS